VLSAYSNTLTDGGSDLPAVPAGPFLIVVTVSEDYFNGLPCHAFDDSAVLLANELNSEKAAPSNWVVGTIAQS
jgi:hypothetical protein